MWGIKWEYARGGPQYADVRGKFAALQLKGALEKSGATAEIWETDVFPQVRDVLDPLDTAGVATGLADMFRADDSRFDRSQFLAAYGLR